jgi:hypothetical protein
MPTGLTNTPGIIGAGSPGPNARPSRAAINNSVKAVFPTTGLAVNLPAIAVPANCSVYIRAHNGSNAGNTDPCRVAINPEGLLGTKGDVITPDTEITYPVNNLAQIWAIGLPGDGIIVSIRASAT